MSGAASGDDSFKEGGSNESRAEGPKQDGCSVAWTTSWPVGLLIGRVQDKRKCDDRGRKQAGAEPWAGERWALGAPVSSLTGS